jgi:hypothetical protein
VLKRYENIVGLWFYWKKLDLILHQRATLVDEDQIKEPMKSESRSRCGPRARQSRLRVLRCGVRGRIHWASQT